MRETKFRGIDTSTGEWITGYYGYKSLTDEHFIIIPTFDTYTGRLPEYFSDYVVIPESVGQCTGVKDEDGNEICGGDVLELYLNDYGDIKNPEKFIVNCDKKFFSDVCYLQQIEAHIKHSDTNDYIKIVGNIYDNPELVTS